MIKNIKLQNFKSLVDIDIELKNLNILIGPNASGKSNFLSFFRLLRAGAQEELNSAINSMGGISNVIHYGDKETGSCSWELEFSDVDFPPDPNPTYEVKIVKNGYSNYAVFSEKLLGTGRDIQKHIYLSRVLRELKLEASDSTITEGHNQLKDYELSIVQMRDRYRYPMVDEIRNLLMDWQIYHGFGEESLRNMRSPQLFNVIDPLRLDPLGRNLLSVIQELANGRRYEAIYERLIGSMQAVFPDFIKLYTPTSAGGMGSLFYGSKNFSESIPALNMSDGQLRFLGLVIILLLADLPNPPLLIVIDEPEIGMHPDMVAVFADLLRIASEKTQIIIATHSPQLIDAMSPEDIIVAEREEGKTTLRRLEPELLNRWLERYTLGKLWTMGKLEA